MATAHTAPPAAVTIRYMENTNGNVARGLGDSLLPPPPPLKSHEALFPPAVEYPSEELTVFPALTTPWLSRVRKGWNEIMLMALSTAATLGTAGAIGLVLWWLAGTAGVRP